LLQAISKLAPWAQTVEIAYLPLRQDLLAQNVLKTAQRNFCLGNSPLRVKGHFHWMAESRRFGSKTYLDGGVMDSKILWLDQNFFDFDMEKTGVLRCIIEKSRTCLPRYKLMNN
jgi:hypothetical protein